MKRVIVTGAGGFIGSHLVDALLERDIEVTAVDIKKWQDWLGKLPPNNHPRVSICESSFWGTFGSEFDMIFHVGALARIQPSFDNPLQYAHTNTHGTATILDFAKSRRIPVVYAGSSTADSNYYANPYALSKYQGEQLCRMYREVYKMRVAVARFYNVYGSRQAETGSDATVIGIFEKQLRENLQFTVTGTGEQRRDFCHISDIVAGLINIADNINSAGGMTKPFSLGTGTNYSMNEVAQKFAGGDSRKIKHIDARSGEAGVTRAERMPARTFDWLAQVRLFDYIDERLDEARKGI